MSLITGWDLCQDMAPISLINIQQWLPYMAFLSRYGSYSCNLDQIWFPYMVAFHFKIPTCGEKVQMLASYRGFLVVFQKVIVGAVLK